MVVFALMIAGAVAALWILSARQGNAVFTDVDSPSPPLDDFDRLLTSGVPARGILLRVSSTRDSTGTSGLRRFERRSVLLDVEIPGENPYEISASPFILSNLVRDVLPGATVELRVDRDDPMRIAIVGPGSAIAASGFLPPARDS